MSRNRETVALVIVGVFGTAIIVILGYVLYSTLAGSRARAAIATSTPAATDTVRPPTFTPTPVPSATPTPTATVVPTLACVDGAKLVEHLSHDDQNMASPPSLRPGRRFTKGWRIQNTGTCPWDPSYSVDYVEGHPPAAHMNGAAFVLHGLTAPSETYDVEIKLIAPREPGLYQGYWQMRNAAGVYFGDRLPVAIAVQPVPPATPTNTPRPPTQIEFSLDRARITRGECAVFAWRVTNGRAVYFYREGEAWQTHGVPFSAEHNACPEQTTTYTLRVVRASGWVEIQKLELHVEQPPEAPYVAQLSIEPTQIPEGGCVHLEWKVEGQVTQVRVLRNYVILWDHAPAGGSMRDCPPGSGNVGYTIEAIGPGGTTRVQHTARIGATPVPTPEPLSGTEWQVLAIGGSLPAPAALPLTVLFGQQNTTGEGTIAGWAGCNTYSATYRQTGTLLTVSSPTAGNNTCGPDVLAQEQALLDALHASVSLSWSDGQLALWNQAGEVELNLAASEAAAP